MQAGVQLIDLTGEVIYSNPTADMLLQRGEAERYAINTDGDRLGTADLPAFRAIASQSPARGVIGVAGGDAPIVWLDVHASPAYRQNVMVGIIATFLDISVQIASQIEQARLTRMKIELARILPHELRTPVAVALGWLDMLLAGYLGALTDEQRAAVTSAQGGARRLHVIADRLSASVQPMDIEVFDLLSLVQMVIESDAVWVWTRKRPGDVTIEVDRHRPLIVTNDRNKVKTAVFELVNNAIKFTEEGGHITIAMKTLNGDAIVVVEDDGIGIDPADHERIFEYFYQVDSRDQRRYEGSGIGLAIARELAAWCLGDVTVHSALGEGSSFRLKISRNMGG